MLSNILANLRTNIGNNHNKRLRKLENKIPAVIYVKHKNSLLISLDHNIIYYTLKKNKSYETPINIKINDEIHTVNIKNIQYHQYKQIILHIDFMYI
ncbi:MAG: 50S ribosomal protein L25 [Candidatus Azosocius agrarius]|nr:MAG: 50S ribosomal protein L25 [Gammaproteobacteria bacterium]